MSFQSSKELCYPALMRRLGANRRDLIDVYYKQCRSVLELAAPAWTPGLTKSEINQLERVQKAAC